MRVQSFRSLCAPRLARSGTPLPYPGPWELLLAIQTSVPVLPFGKPSLAAPGSRVLPEAASVLIQSHQCGHHPPPHPPLTWELLDDTVSGLFTFIHELCPEHRPDKYQMKSRQTQVHRKHAKRHVALTDLVQCLTYSRYSVNIFWYQRSIYSRLRFFQ